MTLPALMTVITQGYLFLTKDTQQLLPIFHHLIPLLQAVERPTKLVKRLSAVTQFVSAMTQLQQPSVMETFQGGSEGGPMMGARSC